MILTNESFERRRILQQNSLVHQQLTLQTSSRAVCACVSVPTLASTRLVVAVAVGTWAALGAAADSPDASRALGVAERSHEAGQASTSSIRLLPIKRNEIMSMQRFCSPLVFLWVSLSHFSIPFSPTHTLSLSLSLSLALFLLSLSLSLSLSFSLSISFSLPSFSLSHPSSFNPSQNQQDRWSLRSPQASSDRRRHRNCFPTRPAQAFPKK